MGVTPRSGDLRHGELEGALHVRSFVMRGRSHLRLNPPIGPRTRGAVDALVDQGGFLLSGHGEHAKTNLPYPVAMSMIPSVSQRTRHHGLTGRGRSDRAGCDRPVNLNNQSFTELVRR